MSVATVIDSGRIVRNQFTEGWWAEFTEPPLKVKEPGYKAGKNKAGWHPKITECSQCHSLQSPHHQSSVPLDAAPVTPREDTTAVTTTTCHQNGLSTIPDPLEKYFF